MNTEKSFFANMADETNLQEGTDRLLDSMADGFEQILRNPMTPGLMQITLGDLRKWVDEWRLMGTDIREDILELLETIDLPDEAIVQVTQISCGILTDDEGHVLSFA
jgi:hypothetical protein